MSDSSLTTALIDTLRADIARRQDPKPTAAETMPTTSRAQADREHVAALMRDGATLEEATSALYQRDAAAQLAKERLRRMSTPHGAIDVTSNGEAFHVPAPKSNDEINQEKSSIVTPYDLLVQNLTRENFLNGVWREGWNPFRVNEEAFKIHTQQLRAAGLI